MFASRIVVVSPKIERLNAPNDLLKRFVGRVAGSAVGSDSGDADRPQGFGALFAFNDNYKLSVLQPMDTVKWQVGDFQIALRLASIGVSPNESLFPVALNAFVQRDQSAVGVANFKNNSALKVLVGSQVFQGNAKCVANSVNGATREAMK
jgi:hypothetical protein